MKTRIRKAALLLGTVAVMAPASAVDYEDVKVISGGLCAPYASTPSPDYSKLRFRAGGVTNESDSYLYVICGIARDSEEAWGSVDGNADAVVRVYFRGNATGTDACTLTVGTTAFGTNTYTGSVTTGYALTAPVNFFSVAAAYDHAPATLVCRISPKHTLSLVVVRERNVNTDGYEYIPPAP